jgi:hypothetical protein
MRKARKILALVAGVGAVGCASPGAPLLKASGELVAAAVSAVSRATRPLTAPDGRPACGNVVGKGPRPPGCA